MEEIEKGIARLDMQIKMIHEHVIGYKTNEEKFKWHGISLSSLSGNN